tara:strand:+ start:48 stop:941 length:894 start_codon:yes stop_codon:yes gene_type:complete
MIFSGTQMDYLTSGAINPEGDNDWEEWRKLAVRDHYAGNPIPFENLCEKIHYTKLGVKYLKVRDLYVENEMTMDFKIHNRRYFADKGKLSGHYWLENKETGEKKDWWFNSLTSLCDHFDLEKKPIYRYTHEAEEAFMIKYAMDRVKDIDMERFLENHQTIDRFCVFNVLAEYHKNPGKYNIRYGNMGVGNERRNTFEFVSACSLQHIIHKIKLGNVPRQLLSVVVRSAKGGNKRGKIREVDTSAIFSIALYMYNMKGLGISYGDWLASGAVGGGEEIWGSKPIKNGKKKRRKRKRKL